MNHQPRMLRLPGRPALELVEQGRPAPGVPSLLLLHGITDSWRSFEPLLPHLPDHWHVVALSQRGHGGSDKSVPCDRSADFAADALAVIDALRMPRPVVVGHSMGAHHALRMAVEAPDRLGGLALLGAFAGFRDKADLMAWHTQDIEPLADPVPRALAESFQLGTLTSAIDRAWLDLFVDESLRVPARIWREGFAGLFDDAWMDRLQGLPLPAWLAWGEADAYVPRSDQQRLLAMLPQARLSTYAAGHALHWELPARIARDLERFVRDL